jgi:hypothetical protein
LEIPVISTFFVSRHVTLLSHVAEVELLRSCGLKYLLNDTSNVGATTWVKEDKTPNLGCSTRNPGVKQIPSDTTKVPDIIDLFFGDNFFEMLSKETNLYYFQNQGEYDSSSKGLKWVDVSVVCATHKKRSETRCICKFCLVLLHKGEECFQRYHTLKHY